MENIKDYIVNGKGYGIKLLAILSLVMAVIFANQTKDAGEFLIPHFQAAIDAMLPIKIENGSVVEPYNTVKTYNINFGADVNFPVVIDTTIDSLNAGDLKQGIYLTRKNAYVAASNKITTYPLDGNNYYPAGDYSGAMQSLVVWTAIIASVFMLFVYFFVNIVLARIFSLLAIVVAMAFNRKTRLDIEMRLSVCSLIAATIISWVLALFGIEGFWLFATITLLLEILIFNSVNNSYDLPLRQRTTEKI